MNNTTILILAIVALFVYKGSQENEESWEIQRDDSGKLIGITVHRTVRNNLIGQADDLPKSG